MKDDDAKKIIKKIERLSGLNKVAKIDSALSSIVTQPTAFEKAIANIAAPTAFDSTLSSFVTQPTAFEKAIASITAPTALDGVLSSFVTQHTAFEKAIATITAPTVLDSALSSFVSQPTAFEKAIASFATPSALDSALSSFVSQPTVFEKAVASIAAPSALDSALSSFVSQPTAFDKAIANIVAPSAIDGVLKLFTNQQSAIEQAAQAFSNASSIIIKEPSCMLAMAESISSFDNYDSYISDNQSNNINFENNDLNEVSDSQAFILFFKKLPPLIQVFFFYLLISVVIPQVNSISANLLTPVVDSYLFNNEKTAREKVKEIKNLSLTIEDITTYDLKFITGDGVRLREEATTQSAILDEMRLGQIVTVLSKKRNWTEIMYEYENGEVYSGWVFSRYTAKFSKQ